ncbi:ComEC/Rec2 family competence protein [Pedobacter metabolipauper]|uniref:Competence protein ComEC n=1 Tax=Pedobacter metabolipauper TaxID=425513 RepID=A0A4R6SXL7_9SPHI|nr:ComEC/Rec2 family competence protein [Pedobacter metabolipauper]TDQ11146.1 competence protein ComEC [Pedobacter metabolipauper]
MRPNYTRSEFVFVRILAPFALGIFLFYPVDHLEQITWLYRICAFLLLIVLFVHIFYKRLKAYRFKGINGLIIYLFIFSLGGLCSVINKQPLAADHYKHQKANYLKVMVDDEPQLKGHILKFKAKVICAYQCSYPSTTQNQIDHYSINAKFDQRSQHSQGFQRSQGSQRSQEDDQLLKITTNTATGTILIAVRTNIRQPINLIYGDQLVIPSKLNTIDPPFNPSEFDYRFWLAAQHIDHQAYLYPNQLVKTKSNTGNIIKAFALKTRAAQVSFYRKVIKGDDAFALASTLILGYRADLSQETLSIYSKTGTIHALSVSGMHVGLIYLIINWALQFLNRSKLMKYIKTFLILALIWMYALLTGFSPSVLRSAIMLSVFIIAKTCSRRTNSYNTIAFSAFCLLVYEPFLIWDVGFQLSFLAVLGLIYLQPKIQNWVYIKNKWINKIWSATAISLAAQLITTPFSLYYFHQFPVYFLLSNLFIMLPTALLMYLGILILLGKFEFLGPAFEWLINFTNSGLEWISTLPGANLSSIWLNKIELLLLCMALTTLATALSSFKKMHLYISLMCFLMLQSIHSYGWVTALKQKKMIIYNLRKHHATAFIYAERAIVMTDLDPNGKAFHYFIKPGLDRDHVQKIIFINGNRDTTTSFFSLKGNTITFLKFRMDKFQLLNYDLKKNKAYLIE